MSTIQFIHNSRITKHIAVFMAILILDPVFQFQSLKAAAGGQRNLNFQGLLQFLHQIW